MNEAIVPPSERIVIQSVDSPVRLMQLAPTDAKAYYDLITHDLEYLRLYDDAIADKYPSAEAIQDSIEHPKNPKIYRFGVWDDDTLVGGTNLTVNKNQAEIGFWTGKQYSGHGYAIQAQRLLLNYAFGILGLDEVYYDIVAENDASIHVAENLGFQLHNTFLDDTGTQMVRYTLNKPSGCAL